MRICSRFSPSVIITSFSRRRHRFFSLLSISFWIRASRAALMAESRTLFSATCSTIFSGLSPCRDRKTMTPRWDKDWGEGKSIKGGEKLLIWRQPCAPGRKWRLQNPLDSQARTVQFPGSQLLCSTRFRSILPPRRCLRAPIHLPKETKHQHVIYRIWWLHHTRSNETYVTHVYFEGGTPGYRAVGGAAASWCASAAEALWPASPPYHSRLLKVQKMDISIVLSNKP